MTKEERLARAKTFFKRQQIRAYRYRKENFSFEVGDAFVSYTQDKGWLCGGSESNTDYKDRVQNWKLKGSVGTIPSRWNHGGSPNVVCEHVRAVQLFLEFKNLAVPEGDDEL
jgi:hypothetical protein